MLNGLLSTAGALISVYIVFALLVSHASEAISALLNQRGRALYDGIVALLGGTKRAWHAPGGDAEAKSIAEYLYEHPLISTLGSTGKRLPAYMESRTFTLSLISVLRDTVPIVGTDGKPRGVDITSAPDALLADLQDRIAALGLDDNTSKSLTLVLQGAARTYDGALTAIDRWFDAQMDRVSGAYRRWIGGWQALIALIFVAVANADTIGILQQVSGNAALVNVVQSASPSGTDVGGELAKLSTSGLMLGWSPASMPVGALGWAAKLGGLLLTWGAVLLGAPFWFDLLKRIVPIRATGGKPNANCVDGRDAQVNPS